MAKPKLSSIVKPIISVEGETHALVKLFDGEGSLPVLKSIGYASLGHAQWVSYVITSQGMNILTIEVSEPDVRGIAEETAKIEFVNNFMTVEE